MLKIKDNVDLKKLQELIEEIETETRKRSLSDKYLSEKGCSTRDDIGIKEYPYGIVMIPEDWVLPYLKHLVKLMSLENHLKFIYEEYILEDDKNLDKSAKELKEHYKYVLKDLEDHEYIELNRKGEEYGSSYKKT